MADEQNKAPGPNQRTAKEVQQNFAENFGYNHEIIWDFLSEEQRDVLEAKIKLLMPDQQKGQNAVINARTTLFDSIWAQRKYTNRNSLSTIIYVLVTEETDFNVADNSTRFSCHPVFRMRRCTGTNNVNSTDFCMIFVDEVGRVYQNWNAYKDENVLPKGTMIAPRRGIYQMDSFGNVELDKYATPASSITKTIVGIADTTSAVGGFLAACVPVAAFLTLPVSAPLMAAAGGIGLAAAGYSAIRSGAHLVERNQHEQSNSLADRQARGAWLGVVGGVVGLGAAGATSAMAATAVAGKEVGLVAQTAVNGLNITAIMISGGGMANSIFDLFLKYQDDEEISTMDVLQLSASLALFTHSMYNFRMASSIISETQNGTIRQIRENLSNRQRRAFDKLSKETIRIRGTTRGKMDIIRGVNEVPSKQQLNDVFKINKQLNERGVRPSFAPEGKGLLLNNDVVVNSQELRASVQHNQGPDILGSVTKTIPESFTSGTQTSGITAPHTNGGQLLFVKPEEPLSGVVSQNWNAGVAILNISTVIVEGVAILLSDFGPEFFDHISNAEGFESVVTHMAKTFSSEGFIFIMNLARTFIDIMLDKLLKVLQFGIATETILYRMVKHILATYSHETIEQLEKHTLDILTSIEKYFLSLNPNNDNGTTQTCKVCNGSFKIVDL